MGGIWSLLELVRKKLQFLNLMYVIYSFSGVYMESSSIRGLNIIWNPAAYLPFDFTSPGLFLHEPGANSSCIEEQVAQFVLHCQRRVLEGKKESKSDGVLIFDEVVISRLMWNSRSQTLIGLSMTHEEMASLADICETICDNGDAAQTTHILQFRL